MNKMQNLLIHKVLHTWGMGGKKAGGRCKKINVAWSPGVTNIKIKSIQMSEEEGHQAKN